MCTVEHIYAQNTTKPKDHKKHACNNANKDENEWLIVINKWWRIQL
jgi:hypothetical protein